MSSTVGMPFIEKTIGGCGGDARSRDTRIQIEQAIRAQEEA